MNNFNNIKLSNKLQSIKNNQNKKRIVKVDLAKESYDYCSKKLDFDFLQKIKLLLLTAELPVDKRERERERENKNKPPTRNTAEKTK